MGGQESECVDMKGTELVEEWVSVKTSCFAGTGHLLICCRKYVPWN